MSSNRKTRKKSTKLSTWKKLGILFSFKGALIGIASITLATTVSYGLVSFIAKQQSFAAATFVQSASNTGTSTTSVTATFGATPTSGNLLIAVVGSKSNVTINEPAGWSTAINQSGAPGQAIFYKISDGTETSVTGTTAATTNSLGVAIHEYSGVDGVLDQTASNTGTSNSPSVGPLTTDETDQLLFAAFIDDVNTNHSDSSWSDVEGFTERTDFKTTGGSNKATYATGDSVTNTAGSYTVTTSIGPNTAWRGQLIQFTVASPTFEQSAFRLFNNANSADVGSALAAQDTGATLAADGDAFRLRQLLHIGTENLPVDSQKTFKLQFAERSGTCDTSFTGETYADVTGSTAIAFNDNAAPADGDTLTGNVNDPAHSGHTTVDQTYEELNNFTNPVATVNAGQDGMWDFSLVDNTAPASTFYCFRVVESDGTLLDTYSVIPEIETFTPPTPQFEQSAYRLFNNANSTDVGTALAAQDTPATLGASGDEFRLRANLHVTTANLSTSGDNFKLQFAERSGTCDTSFTGETYADVTGSTIIAYNDNLLPADGATLTGNANDPVHSGHTTVDQTYEELNNFTNSVSAINIGEDGMWDFSLVDNGADGNQSYCLRIVKSDGTPLNTYSVIPEVTIAPATYNQVSYRWFENDNSTDVGTAMAAQNTSATLASNAIPFRLRQLIHVSDKNLPQDLETFKLQFSPMTVSCDTGFVGETYVDVTTSTDIAYNDNTSPSDGDTLTGNANDPTHGGDTVNDQTYEELNNFSNSVSSIPNGQDGMWDFALLDNDGLLTQSYCLRVVKSDGSLLDSYTNIPQINTFVGNLAPTGLFNGVTQKTDGSGDVDISIEVDDGDNNDTRAQVEYETDSDGACDGPWAAATLTGPATADFNDSGGAPDVNNGNTYQVGSTATTRIITSSGSNTVQFDWDSDADLPTADGTQCLRLTVNDDLLDQTTPDTQTVVVDNVDPTISAANLTIDDASCTGTGGVCKIGDTVTFIWDDSGTGDNNGDIDTVVADLTEFGGGGAVAMTDTTACGGTAGDDVYESCLTVTAGSIDASGLTFDVTATDTSGNVGGPTTSTDTGSVDNIAPNITDGNIDVTGESGTGGEFIIGDTVVVTWDASAATGDNELDLGSATADLSDWGGSATAAMTDTTACGGTASDDIYEACLLLVEGAIDTGSAQTSVDVTDNAGNTASANDGSSFAVDTIRPDLTSWNLDMAAETLTLVFDESVDASTLAVTGITVQDAATAGTSYTLTDSTTASGDGTTIVIDLSATDLAGLEADDGLATSASDSFLTITTGVIDDVSGNDNTAIADGSGQAVNTYTGDSEYSQSGYRFFANADSTDVGTALAGQDSAATLSTNAQAFRLRALVHHAVSDVASSGKTYKLQFAVQSGACDTGFTGETYADVTAATAIAYNDNATPADGATLTGNAGDPVHSGHTNVDQTYEELNNFTNSVAAVEAGQDGMWDFALIDNDGTAPETYCLRIVDSSGTVLDSYDTVFEISTISGNTAPTGSFNSASQKTDGSGDVDLSIEVDDADDDDTRAQLEYETDSDGACDGPWAAATLTGPATADFNDSGGAPDVNNGNTYQVGSTATTRIITSSGSNTVDFDWDSDTDLPSANGTQCLRLTVNDDTEDQTTPATQTVVVDNVDPTVTAANMVIDDVSCTGTSGECIIGDTVTFIWDNSGTGDNNGDIDTAVADLTEFGGGAAASMTDTTACGGTAGDDVYEACLTITAGSIDASGLTFDVTATDTTGNVTGPITSTDTASVDNIAPNVTDANIEVTGASGVGGAFIVGDTVTVTWDASAATGDNELDLGIARADLSDWGGSSTATMTDTTACGGSSGDDIFEACFTLVSGAIDTTTASTSLDVDDDAGNDTQTADSGLFTVDTDEPELTSWSVDLDANTITLVFDQSVDASELDVTAITLQDAATAGTSYSFTDSTTASGDGTTIVIDLSATDEAAIEADDDLLTSQSNSYITITTSAENDLRGNNNVAIADGAGQQAAAFAGDPKYRQSAYRWFANDNSTDVGAALAAQDTSHTLASNGEAFRLRETLHVFRTDLATSGETFKLQFAVQSGTCDTGFTGETYADVTAATAIAYNDNGAPADGDDLTDNANDPVHSGHTNVNQDYEELNNFTNSVATIPSGDDGLWDFALIDNDGISPATYCFRVVKSDNSLLDNYDVVPEISTISGNTAPTGSFNSASQKTDGSGDVDLSIEVDDADDDDTRAQLEYETDSDGACDGPWAAATLTGPATADFNDSGGAPDVNNGNTYQVGSTATTRIITSSGSNTVDFDWDSDTDLPSANGTQCLRLTVNDDIEDQTTPATQTVVVDNVDPTVTAANLVIDDLSCTGTSGECIIGDTVTFIWDNSGTGDNNSDIDTAVADLTEFGGGGAVAMTDTTACGGTAGDDVYEACLTITAGSIDAAGLTFDVTATDTTGNVGGPTTSTDTASVDNITPNVTDANIDVTGASGVGGAFIVGDTVTVTWDASAATGDNELDLGIARADLSDWGGSATATMTDTTACGGTASDDIYEACFTLTSGAIDTTTASTSLDVDDDAGNDTQTADSGLFTVDTDEPELTSWSVDLDANTITLTFDQSVDASELDVTAITLQDAATAGTSYTLTDSTTASGDGTTIVIDLSATDEAAIEADDDLLTSQSNSYITITTSTENDLRGNDNVAIVDGAGLQAAAFAGDSKYRQSAYRWFANDDSTDVGAALAAQDTSHTLASNGEAFRLRETLHVFRTDLATSGETFKLQFAVQSGTCDTGFTGETYADVTAATAIAYNDNGAPADGDDLTDNTNDPVHSGHTNVNQDYEELNNFTNSVATIPSGDDGLWDFALIDNDGSTNTTYCLRVVKSDNSLLDNYDVIPQIETIVGNSPPTGAWNSATQKTDGSGDVDLSIEVDDADDDDTRAQLEYETDSDGACDGPWAAATLTGPATADFNDSGGAPDVNNGNTYQIGSTATTRIITTSGSNTVDFDWDSDADLPSANGTQCLRLTVNDDTEDQTTPATQTVTVDNTDPTVSAGNLVIDDVACTGTSGECIIGDTVTFIWDNSGTGDNNGDIDTALADLTEFGGGAAASMTDTTACGGTAGDDVYEACLTITAGAIDASGLTFDVTATDTTGNVTGPVTSTDTASVDNIAPNVTDANIDVTGASGVGGAFIVGDTVTVTWDASAATGDNELDLGIARADLSDWGGSATATMTDTTACGGAAGDDIWEACFTLTSGAIDTTTASTSLDVDDDAGNDTQTADSGLFTVDTDEPELTSWSVDLDANTITLTFDQSVDASELDVTAITLQDAATAGTSYTLTDSTTASGDGTTIVIDLSATDEAAIEADDDLLTSQANSYITITTAAENDLRGNDNVAIADGAGLQAAAFAGDSKYRQSAYRWFSNDDSTDVGAALAAQDTNYTLTTNGEAFRLRETLHVFRTDLATSGETFKLQFAVQSGTCDTGFTGETYTDVTAATAIAYNDNGAPADGDDLTDNANDPVHSGHTNVNQDYEELNNFTNSVATIPSGDDGLWDFALIDNDGISPATYCFRVVKSDNSLLNNYDVIPEITTSVGNSPPTGAWNSATQKTDGSGDADLSIEVDDADDDDTRAQIEYETDSDGACDGPWAAATLAGPATADFNDSGGAPDVNNGNTYQVGSTATTRIITTSGSNTVDFDWDSDTDLPSANGTQCLRLTANDDSVDQTTPDTQTIVIDNVDPTVTAANMVIDDASCTGTSGECIIGDDITFIWDNSGTGDNNDDISSVISDLTELGGGAAVPMTDTTACGGTAGDDVYESCITVVAGSIDASGLTFDATATDDVGNTTGPISSTDTASVDNIAPNVTDANIDVTGASGVGGAFIVGDTVTVTWDASAATGDNELDLGVSRADLSDWGGSATATMTDTTACGGTASDDIYEACFTLVSGAIDTTTAATSLDVDDDAGNNTVAADSGTFTVDTDEPELTSWSVDLDANTITLTFDQSVDASELDVTAITLQDAATAGTSYTLTDSTTASGDGTTIVIDLSATDEAAIEADDDLLTSQSNSYITITTSAENDLRGNDNVAIADGAGLQAAAFAGDSKYRQSAYRWFANDDSTDVGAALAAQDTNYTLTTNGEAFRLRETLHVFRTDLATSGETFKLQFAVQSGTCDTGFTGETYSDVTAATAIAYNDNGAPADGDDLTDNTNDPVHAGHTNVNQDYEELNNFTNSVATIPSGDDGLWDFALIDNDGSSNVTYCLRVVKSDNSLLNNYDVVPEITTVVGNSPPTGAWNSATQKTDGSSDVDLSIEVDDADDDDTRAQLEYETDSDGACDGPWAAATLTGPATADFNDSGGAPDVNNGNTYQVGSTATTRIITSSGSNTVDFDWDSDADLPSANGTQCLRLTVNDDTEDQTTPATQTVTVDNTDPTVTAANMVIDDASCTGTSGECIIGDDITFIWDNSGTGDNNGDIDTALADLTEFGGGGAVAMTDTTACGGTAGDDVYESCITVVAGSIDASDLTFDVTATDTTGNVTGPITSTDTASVDNIAPNVTDTNIDVTGASGVGGAFIVGDTVTVTWDASAATGDNELDLGVARADLSDWGGSSTATMTDTTACGGTASDDIYEACFTLTSGAIDTTTASTSLDVDDDAGNDTQTADSGLFTVDTDEPELTSWSVDLDANTITLTFDQSVDASELDVTAVTLQDAATAGTSYTLTDSTTASGDGTTIVIDLSATDEAAIEADDDLLTSQSNSYITITTAAENDLRGNDNVAIADGAGLQAAAFAGDPKYRQSAYRWFANDDSTDVGSPLAAQDTNYTLTTNGEAFRLRETLHVFRTDLATSGETFKLQFAVQSGTCDTGFTGETYADVTAATAIAYNDNGAPADGDDLTDNANDPVHSGHTNVNQDYEELNNFTNSVAAIPSGDDGLWDFALIDNDGSTNTTYCLRVVKSDNSLLDNYDVIPQIETIVGNSPPTGAWNSATQKTDGSGDVDLSIEVNDADLDDTRAQLEYETDSDGACDGPWAAATLAGPATADFNDSGGAPDVNNGNTYQVGSTATTRIITSSGSNTVDFDWDSDTDLPSANGTQCLRLTANDDSVDQTTPDTLAVFVDNTDPVIATVVADPNSGTIGVGDSVDVTFDANETGLTTSTCTLNGVNVAGTFNDNLDGTYTISYTVTEGASDWSAGNLPISCDFTDAYGNSTTATAFTDGNTLAGDANTPSVTAASISPATGIVGIGDPVTVTLTAGESGLGVGACTLNGEDVSGTFVDNTDGTYSIAYTPTEGDSDWTSGNLPLSCTLTDAGGNFDTISAFTDGNTLAGDANSPVIASTSVSPDSGDVSPPAVITVTLGALETGLVVGPSGCTVNGIDVAASITDNLDGSYDLTYNFSDGHSGWTAGNLPITCQLADAAGNTGSTTTFDDGNTLRGVVGGGGGGGGGGGTILQPLPSNLGLSINAGAECTPVTKVIVTATGQNADSILLSDEPQFINTPWQPFDPPSGNYNWTFEVGDGEKTIYAIFRNANGRTSSVIQENILVDTLTDCGEVEVIDPVEPVDPEPEVPEIPTPPVEGACDIDCDKVTYDIFIVNPDGTERHMNTIYSISESLGPNQTRVFFEDRGSDFDYNDVRVDVDQTDCSRISFALEVDGNLNHEVWVTLFYEGTNSSETLLLWSNSQTGAGTTRTINVNSYPDICEQIEIPQGAMCTLDCSRVQYDVYIVNPDGSERHMNSRYAQFEDAGNGRASVKFEDKGFDFDFNDVVVNVDKRNCSEIFFNLNVASSWDHEVRARILYSGTTNEQDIQLWPSSQAGDGTRVKVNANAIPALCFQPTDVPQCRIDCSLLGYDVYIVNEDGSERHTNSEFVQTERVDEDISIFRFEDRGIDLDFDDVAVTVNKSECSDIQFSLDVSPETSLDHEVRADLFYAGSPNTQDVLLWPSSQLGSGTTVSIDANTYPSLCEEVSTPSVSPCDIVCAQVGYDLFIELPDGTERHMFTEFTEIEPLGNNSVLVKFEDLGEDFDYDDVWVEVNRTDCENIRFTVRKISADLQHAIKANITYRGVEKDVVTLWPNSHAATQTRVINIHDFPALCIETNVTESINGALLDLLKNAGIVLPQFSLPIGGESFQQRTVYERIVDTLLDAFRGSIIRLQ